MKPGTAKAKGRETEDKAVSWLIEHGWIHAERKRLTGAYDQGDITGIPGMCIEVKSAANWTPMQWLRELDAEIINSHADIGYVFARPKGLPNPHDWVILMRPDMLYKLLDQAGWTPE